MIAKNLRIYGLVQGVGYRETMRRQALRLGVSGWVRNRRDGSVEALVCGDAEQVAQMLEWANRGPYSAQVERVVESHATEAPDDGSFEVLYTE